MRRAVLLMAFVAAALGLGVTATRNAEAATTCTFTIAGSTMRLNADCTTDATIIIPNGMTLDGRGKTITAVDPGAGHFLGAIVKNGGASANVKNLKLATAGLANACDGGDDRLRGILFQGASGTISDNTVQDIRQGPSSGCQEGNGIEARNEPFDGTGTNPTRVTITNNRVTQYQKTGIVANGNVVATVKGNYVSGIGPVGSIAQNGIQVGYGATGQVKDNTVLANAYTGPGWSSTGILLFQASSVMVQGNTVTDSQVGIAIETWGCYAGGPAGANDNQVVNNTISGAEWGVTVVALSWAPYSECDARANGNKIVNNTIRGLAGIGDQGIYFGAYVVAGPGTPQADGNRAVSNSISGFATPIEVDGATGTALHANDH
ncbi:MAG: right-handed parallel beta-helix repeat-containing protein [Dehalococcoidia bacterium]